MNGGRTPATGSARTAAHGCSPEPQHLIEHAKLKRAYEQAPHGFKRTALKALQRFTHDQLGREVEERRKRRAA